ncbi:head-tail connector protein [Acinetobacter colistiniresistens]|uniref:Phage gp6-like head-tail connector protein n=1 Tax=Acinetobacter colistiniresistens TaxID=280145 RepID=A0A558EZM7_9GAMM|nr:head-tail connector protein [Acinetobacter colistiniresistens]TVT78608.1 phage gp6-like head-tail connector protein [Acinetobacter colistiniresistens]
MPILTVEQVKLRLKIDTDDEDSDLQLLIDAALSTFEEVNNRKLFELGVEIPENVANGIHASPSIVQGALSLIGYWHENPEATGNLEKLPKSTTWAWSRHRFINVG